MGFIIFLLFMLVPIIEIIGFIQIGGLIGVWATIGIVILTAIIGSVLLRHQGMAVMFKAQSDLRRGAVPIDSMVTGMFLAFAGALLLTPGFFTDILGLLLFLPPFREFVAEHLFKGVIAPKARQQFRDKFSEPGNENQPRSGPGRGPHAHPNEARPDDGDGPIIDGTYEEVKPDEPKISGGSTDKPDQKKNGDGSTPWSRH